MRVAVLAAAMAALLACAGNVQPTRQIDDAILARQVQDALRGDRTLRLYDITVDARSGLVTLTGVVRTQAERERAGEIARSVAGVVEVENLLSTG
jgi:hyperosmotically inducible protein